MMEPCAPFFVVAALLLAADEPKPGRKDAPAPPGWSFATEGDGIPPGRSATDYAVGIDHQVTHGGRAAVFLRSVVGSPRDFRSVNQFVKADEYRGRRLRLSGYLKTRDVAAGSAFWLRVDWPDAFVNVGSRPAKGTTDWARHEVVLDVPEAAMRLSFGPLLAGAGQVWADDLTLEVVDPKEVPTTAPAKDLATRFINLDFEAAGAGADDPVPGWEVHGGMPEAAIPRIVAGGAHAGRAALEMKSTHRGASSFCSAGQTIAAGPYRGKRVRFRTYLKTEGVADAAFVSMASLPPGMSDWGDTSGRASKGTTGWRPHEVVIDVRDKAEGLSIAVFLRGTGTVGVDDASVEIVDPAEVSVTTKSVDSRSKTEQRTRELAGACEKLSDRPENLDFER